MPKTNIELSSLDKQAPPDVEIMIRLCHPSNGRRPPEKIADYTDIAEARKHGDQLTKTRMPWTYLTWWRRNGRHVKKWATLMTGKRRHFRLMVPFVQGITDDMIKSFVRNALLTSPDKPDAYDTESIGVAIDADANRVEADATRAVVLRLSPDAAAVLKSMPMEQAAALVEAAITADNGAPGTKLYTQGR